MPEGPSIMYLKEKLVPFEGKKVTDAGGYTPMPTGWIKNKKLLAVNSWGKHLLLQFKDVSIKVHLMLFGSFLINKSKKVNASLYLRFGDDIVNFYVVRCEKLEGSLEELYDWRTDPFSRHWSPVYVAGLVQQYPKALIADLLLDQLVFTGVGNIIRNEVLFRARLHPLSVVAYIPKPKITKLVKEVKKYSVQFLNDKKAGTLSKNWQAYEAELCPRDGIQFEKKWVGKTKRKVYYCNCCQTKYTK